MVNIWVSSSEFTEHFGFVFPFNPQLGLGKSAALMGMSQNRFQRGLNIQNYQVKWEGFPLVPRGNCLFPWRPPFMAPKIICLSASVCPRVWVVQCSWSIVAASSWFEMEKDHWHTISKWWKLDCISLIISPLWDNKHCLYLNWAGERFQGNISSYLHFTLEYGREDMVRFPHLLGGKCFLWDKHRKF